jgi:hypothetical protein
MRSRSGAQRASSASASRLVKAEQKRSSTSISLASLASLGAGRPATYEMKNPDGPRGWPAIALGRYCSWRIVATSSRLLLTPVLSKIDLR